MCRMKKALVCFISGVVVCMAFAASGHAQLKIGYIRSDYIFSKYEPYLEAQKQLDEYQKKEFDNLQKMKLDLDNKIEDARSKELLMTPEMKQQKMEELTKQGQDLENRYDELVNPDTGLMVKKQTELLQPIIERINEVIMGVAKTDEYDYILDATPGPQGNSIIFANEQYDISESILQELQKDTSN